MADGSLEYLLSLEVEGAREAAAEVQAAAAQMQQSLSIISTGAEDSGSALESLRADLGLDELNDRIEKASIGLQDMGQSASQAGSSFGGIIGAVGGIAAVGTAIQVVLAAVEAYKQQIEAAAETLRSSSRESADLLKGTQDAFRSIATEEQRVRFIENTREDIQRLKEEVADLSASMDLGVGGDFKFMTQAEFAIFGSAEEFTLKAQQIQSMVQLVGQLNGLVDEAQGKSLFDAAAFEEQAQRFQDATRKLEFFELGDDLDAKLQVIRDQLAEAQQDVQDAFRAERRGTLDTEGATAAADAQERVLALKRQELQLVEEISRQQDVAAREAERAAEAAARQETRDEGRRLRDAERILERQLSQRDNQVDSLVRVGLNIGSVRDPAADDMRRIGEEQVARLDAIRDAISELDITARFQS